MLYFHWCYSYLVVFFEVVFVFSRTFAPHAPHFCTSATRVKIVCYFFWKMGCYIVWVVIHSVLLFIMLWFYCVRCLHPMHPIFYLPLVFYAYYHVLDSEQQHYEKISHVIDIICGINVFSWLVHIHYILVFSSWCRKSKMWIFLLVIFPLIVYFIIIIINIIWLSSKILINRHKIYIPKVR